MDPKQIGIILALSSSFLIGASYILTKKGLMSSKGHGTAEGVEYMKSQIWWAGMIVMILGELSNFAAYAYAPAILVTPLGALSVLISAILAAIFLSEKLGRDGIIGCALCLLGSVVIILNAPEDKEVSSIDQLLTYAISPGFLVYGSSVVIASIVLIYYFSPRYGKTHPLVYISICSLVGSITVIASKAFGLALKLTFEDNNQFGKFSTYFFIFTVIGCITIQMNYFNKALDIFSTSVVTPIYYVFFTTATILASVILYQGFYNAPATQITSVFCGFLTIFIGVFLLNAPKRDVALGSSLQGKTLLHNFDEENLGFVGLDDDNDFVEDEFKS